MLPFTLRFEDGLPVSDQIVRAVRRAIATGELALGDPFPSVRAMSQALKISPTTVHKAVSQLKSAGYLVSRPGIGMVVATPEVPSLETRLELLEPACRKLLEEADALQLSFEDMVAALKQAQEKER